LFFPYKLIYIDSKNIDKSDIGSFKVSSIALSHRVSSFAYVFELDSTTHQLKIEQLKRAEITPAPYWGEIQKGKDIQIDGVTHKALDYLDVKSTTKKIIVCGDNDDPILLKEMPVGAEVIVHEAIKNIGFDVVNVLCF
jgi:ribonuclease Z